MHPFLQRARDEIESATAGLTPTQLAFAPAEGKWCCGQILEHLSIAYDGTARLLSKVVAGGPRATPPTMKQRLSTIVVGDLGYFPSGRKAPEGTLPTGIAPEVALRNALDSIVRMDAVLAECEEKYGSRRKIADHPVLGALNVKQWRRFHWVHTRHHMRQVRGLREMQRVHSS
ncbi:MAG TPA: DUF1569 domain-containing protein [Terriglobales bacterium]|nr:DUF1569 domain-containing protein [Terriglobales bacterium]